MPASGEGPERLGPSDVGLPEGLTAPAEPPDVADSTNSDSPDDEAQESGDAEAGSSSSPKILGAYDPNVGPVQFAPRRSKAERLAARRRKRGRRKIVGFSMLGAGVVILLGAGWVSYRAYQAYQHLQVAASLVSQLQDQIAKLADIDSTSVNGLVAKLEVESAAAQREVDDPLYGAATHLPWIGPNLRAVRVITSTVDQLTTGVVPSLIDVAKITNQAALAPRDGAIDLTPIIAVAGPLQRADDAVNAAIRRVSAVDRGELVGPVDRAIVDLWQKLDKAAELTRTGARIGRLLPPMLGANGARTYLVVFQNPAELRATGGIFGSFALVKVDNGKITIVGQGASSRAIGDFEQPVVQLDPALRDLYTNLMATSPVDVNFTPDFPTAASLFATMYRERTGQSVDGVLAMDPVAISYLLAGHQPIPIGRGLDLTSGNIVSILLSQAYAMFPLGSDAPARDAFLDNATASAFSSVMSGGDSATDLLKGLQRASRQRRVLVWSSHPTEEADIAETSLAGRLSAAAGGPPTVGVFFNDGTGAKLGYYLNGSVSMKPGSCDLNGNRELTVTVTMNYSAPASGLPAYVLGDATPDASYVLRTNVLIVAPAGGSIPGVLNDGENVPTKSGIDHGLAVGMITVDLDPGRSATVTAAVLAPPAGVAPGQAVQPAIVVTPGVHTWATSAQAYPACRLPG